MPENNEGLGQNLTPAEVTEYNQAYRKGSKLLKKHMVLHDHQEQAPSPAKQAEVREGIRLLQRAVEIEPGSWPAHWLIGKGFQALDEHERAYEAFCQATRLCTDNADVSRELCLECLQLGKFEEAVEAARLAVQIAKCDPGLQANLALALLLAGNVVEALDQAKQAAAGNPQDEINRNLLAVIQEIKEGRRPQPKTLAEVEG